MAMLGNGRMVIWFELDSPDIDPEHQHWHAHEHMYERLGIPGFLRGRRAISLSAPRKYFVTYEVENFDVLKSAAYHKCLDNPTPWTQKMMPHQRNVVRSLCRIGGSYGSGIGQVIATIRFAPAPGREDALRGWLNKTALPHLPAKAGMVGAHFLEAIKQTGQPPTNEQKLRGANDGEVDWVLLVEGYDAAAVNGVLQKELSADELARHGAAGAITGVYAHDLALTQQDVGR